MDGEGSNIWADQSAGFRWMFDLHVMFPLGGEGQPFLDKTVRLEWRHPLTITHVQPMGAVTAIGGAQLTIFLPYFTRPCWGGTRGCPRGSGDNVCGG